ncbi:hypothetical protein PQI07_27155 [Methylobacterium sp. 092160098-2]|uniref:hypothetical protein n=1 Tax=Methylobacterium sp. 092160098-2 TaxID=3025129 RepID=UPI002381AAF2|nr:hypothetical protein [Methylobacterium sp. 092160098-2]MDE4914353.1 hypothetical protein [Methylobacterium sp. 092160098-2]
MKLLNLMAAAIVVGGGLVASAPSFALCSVPGTPTAGGDPTPGDPETGQPGTPVAETPPPPPPPPHRIPVAVPTYAPWTATQGPGSNEVGSSNGSNSYNNPYNTLAPSARAAVGEADWCRRNGRSQGNTDACLKAVGGR